MVTCCCMWAKYVTVKDDALGLHMVYSYIAIANYVKSMT